MRKLINNLFAVEASEWSTQHELYDISDYTVIKYPAPHGWGRIRIFKEEYNIIGTITAYSIDFDPTPFLFSRVAEGPPQHSVYRIADHFGPSPSYTENPIEAFRSLFYFFYLTDHLPLDYDDWPEEGLLFKASYFYRKWLT